MAQKRAPADHRGRGPQATEGAGLQAVGPLRGGGPLRLGRPEPGGALYQRPRSLTGAAWVSLKHRAGLTKGP